MKRWTDAYPGAVKVVHPLGYFKDSRDAYAALGSHVLKLLAQYKENEAYPLLRSSGYGQATRYWGDIHFAATGQGEDYQRVHGGELWYCVELFGDGQHKTLVEEWLKAHAGATGKPTVLCKVLKNDAGGIMSDETSPLAYAYVNDVDVAVMLKLAMGGRV